MRTRGTTLASLMLLASMVAGCSNLPTEAQSINLKKSRALNIVEAGGIRSGVKDVAIPKDSTGALTDSTLYKMFDASAIAFNPVRGISSGTSLGMGLLSLLIAPDSPGARNSFVAWMPISLANTPEGARDFMLEQFVSSTSGLLNDLGYKYVVTRGRDFPKMIVNIDHWVSLTLDEEQCQVLVRGKAGTCSITMDARIPEKGLAPSFVGNGNIGSAYAFSARDDYRYGNVKIEVPQGFKYSQFQLYEQLSSRMPDWFYLYLTPRQTKMQDGKPLPMPVVLEQGRMNFFAVP